MCLGRLFFSGLRWCTMKDLGTRLVKLAEILVGGYEVRSIEEDPELVDLAKDIAENGLLNPLSVAVTPEGLRLVAGHRRYSACLLGHVVEVPVHVFEWDELERRRAAFGENFHRKDVTAVEQAAAIAEALEGGAMTVEQVAATFRRSVEWVRDQVALLAWPVDLQAAVHARQISVAAARELARVTDENYRAVLLRSAVENGVTARQASAWVCGWEACQPASAALAAELPAAGPGPRPLVPETLCMGCHQAFAPDGMVPVLVCPACVAVLRECGLGRR